MAVKAPMTFTPEQVARYERDGYLVVPGLLTDAEADAPLAYDIVQDKNHEQAYSGSLSGAMSNHNHSPNASA